jgi:multidrug resistance efflux pump
VRVVKGGSVEGIAKVNPKPAPAAAPAPAPDNKAVEAEIAEAQKKLDALNAEIAKRREARGKLTQGTPDYDAANKLVQDIKPDIEKATVALEAAKAKLKKP